MKKLVEIAYSDFISDESNSIRQKINSNILEVNSHLNMIDTLVSHAAKLKKSSGLDQNIFWKSTNSKFVVFLRKIDKIRNKIIELNQ